MNEETREKRHEAKGAMQSLLPFVFLGAVAIATAQTAQQPTAPVATEPPLTLEQYIDAVRGMEREVAGLEAHPEEAPMLAARVPESYTVQEQGRQFALSNTWLRTDLVQLERTPEKDHGELLRRMRARLTEEAAEAERFREPTPLPQAHAKLAEILARREFRKLRGPGLLEVMRDRFFAWLRRMFDKLGGRRTEPEQLAQYIVWIAIAAAACFLAIYLKRMSDRARLAEVPREVLPFAPSATNWRQWLARARAAAQAGDWRGAIHLAYWAAISRLETEGAWPADRARTPREYLRLLPAVHPQRATLTGLTRDFEVVWYGHQSAQADDFARTLLHLEALGCR